MNLPHLLFAGCVLLPCGIIASVGCWHLTETPALRHFLQICDERACVRCKREARPWGI